MCQKSMMIFTHHQMERERKAALKAKNNFFSRLLKTLFLGTKSKSNANRI
ncbi:hypothetical protein [Neobacillus drentensis]